MTTTLSLILLGVACVVFFFGYVFGEAVGYRCGVNDEARRHEDFGVERPPTQNVKVNEDGSVQTAECPCRKVEVTPPDNA